MVFHADSCISRVIFRSHRISAKNIRMGADGATVNRGDVKGGVKTKICEDMLWLIFNWRLVHRLELALKSALKGSSFDKLDEMLHKIHAVYNKSQKATS